MKYLFANIFITISVLAVTVSSGQTSPAYLVQKVEIKGLPKNILYTSLLQDKKGFLWIGTINGLYRYNGLKVDKFLNNPSDSSSLSHNYIQCLEQDVKGNIWVGTYGGGMNKFDFFHSSTERVNSGLMDKDISIISCIRHSAKAGYLWVVSPKMIHRFTQEREVKESFIIPSITPNSRIRDIIESEEDKVLLASGDGIFLVDAANNHVREILSADNNVVNKKKTGYFSLAKDTSGNIWIGGENGLTILNAVSLQPAHQPVSLTEQFFKKDTVIKIFRDREEQFWIATNNKLFIYNAASNTISAFSNQLDNVTDIIQDKQGNIWIVTKKQGLFRVVKPSVAFQLLAGLDAFSQGEEINEIKEETDSTWLIGTQYSLVRYNHHTGILNEINITDKIFKKGVSSIYIDSKKNLWIGTVAEGVFYKSKNSTEFIQIPFSTQDTNSVLFYRVLNFQEDRSGKIWAGIYAMNVIKSGLFYFDTLSKKMVQYIAPAQNKNFLAPIAITQIKKGAGDEIWISSLNGGLFNLTTGNKAVMRKNLTIQSPGKNRITLNITSCVFIDKKGTVWFGTVGGGLNAYYPSKDSVTYFTVADGLPSNLIYCIEEDRNDQLWISTDNGLCRYNKKNNRFTNYNSTSGLSSSNFSFFSSLNCKNGTIAFGTNDGKLIYFDPSSLQKEINNLPTIITDIRISNKSVVPSNSNVLNKAPYLTDTVVLFHDQNVISFELSNMDLGDPENFTYSYKLEGFNKEWNYISDFNSITYTNLDPGTYTLLVKNANHLGIWNEKPSRLVLIIKPPFWQTWWFISLLLLAVAALVYALFRYRLKQQLRVLQVRNRLHRDLHDDVGATLSSVKAYSEILKDNPDNTLIAELIRDNSTDMLERLEVISWATNPQHDNFKSLKNIMIKFATPICHSKNIQFHIESSINEEMMMLGEVRQNIFLVFKEAINNMTKYADAAGCNAKLFIQNSQFFLQVTDDGKGFDGAIKGTGNGWKNMRKRAEDLNGNLTIDSTPGKGTVIVMHFPYPFKIPSSWDTKQH